MTTPRIYMPYISQEDSIVRLEGDNVRYIKTVLRLKEGDRLKLFDGTSSEYTAIIKSLDNRTTFAEIIEKEDIGHPGVHITLAQSLPKSGKMDVIVQKATELGVTKIVPFFSARSIPRLTEAKMSARISRWQKIAVEASKQCRRVTVPKISNIVTFDDMLRRADTQSLRIILWEEETETGLKIVLRDTRWAHTDSFFFVVGPEGGFTREEVTKARANDFVPITLGTQILRTETVALAILAILQYEKGIFITRGEGTRTI